MKIRFVVFALFAVATLTGCPGNELRARTRGIREVIQQARENGAYYCAPKELAMAETHAAFAWAELDAGEYFRARDEVHVADENAKLAFEMSPREKCGPKKPVVAPPKEKDTDGDGIIDKLDKCPTEPEDKDGFEDEDGCPDPDNDQDGILDKLDKCPMDPEDKDGFEDEDGCPDPDNDKDGILDADDKCPNDPGPKENGGCPDKDRDGDTVVDRLDKCPDQPGPPDNDGCPKQKFIVVTKEKIELKQKVHFATDKAKIMSDSFAMLQEIADVLKARPEIRVRIEGHTDSRGSMKHNMKLSQARADSVKMFLVGQGVDSSHMDARGFGPTQPIADNRTAVGREQNRRVEFIITAQ
jgi:outer membrane protein OmpA-like peptidoglycan-associated protein